MNGQDERRDVLGAGFRGGIWLWVTLPGSFVVFLEPQTKIKRKSILENNTVDSLVCGLVHLILDFNNFRTQQRAYL